MRFCLDCCTGRLGNSAGQDAFKQSALFAKLLVDIGAGLFKAFHKACKSHSESLGYTAPHPAAKEAKHMILVYCIAPDMQ